MLIKCPECQREISDKSKCCIHCGYPLVVDVDSCNIGDFFYKVVLEEINPKDKIIIIGFLRAITGLGLADAKKAVENLPYTIHSGMDYDECEKIQKVANTYNAKVSIQKDNISESHNDILEKVNIDSLKNPNYKPINNQPVTCPKCGSTQIQVVRKKFSLLTGFATNKIERICANCLHKF